MDEMLRALARRLRDWDGSEEQALELRAAVMAVPDGGSTDPEGRRVTKVAGPAKNRALPRKLRNQPDLFDLARPLVGAPEMGDWPHADPLGIEESDARTWLELFTRHEVLVDDRVRALATTMFRARRRITWMPAARCIAALARRDAPTRDFAARLWKAAFPKGLPRKWKHELDSNASKRLGADHAHIVRHGLVLGCCCRVHGIDEVPLEPSRLAGMRLPGNDSDQSVVLEGLLELLKEGHGDDVLRHLEARAREVSAHPLSQDVARRLLVFLTDAGLAPDAGAALRERLIAPLWQPLKWSGRFDALWSQLHSARWFQQRGDVEAVDRIRGHIGLAGPALRLVLGERPADPGTRLVGLLARLAGPGSFPSLPLDQREPLLAEAVLLLEDPRLQPVHWPSLVRRALGTDRARLEGTVAEVGFAGLVLQLAGAETVGRPKVQLNEHLPGELIRDLRVGTSEQERIRREMALSLAPVQSGKVSIQVALQTEYLLRLAPSDADRVRLVWWLLQRDPFKDVFRQLALVLRVRGRTSDPERLYEAGSVFHEVVAGVRKLDDLRDDKKPTEPAELSEAFRALASAVRELLGQEDGAPLQELAAALADAIEGSAAGVDEGWLDRLGAVVLGTAGRGGLVHWQTWVSEGQLPAREARPTDKLRERAEAALAQLRSAVTVAVEASPSVRLDQADDVRAAAEGLKSVLAGAGWPEVWILNRLMSDLTRWVDAAVARGRASRALIEELRAALARGEEADVVPRFTEADKLALLPVRELRELHRFLADRMRFGQAGRLRRAVGDRVQLPRTLSFLKPLLIGAALGAFLVLDLGQGWLESRVDVPTIVGAGPPIEVGGRYYATVLVAFSAPLLLMFVQQALLRKPAGLGWGQLLFQSPRLLGVFQRVLFPYLLAVLVAGGFSFAVAWSQDNFEFVTFVLWTGLALFLGVFLHLVVEGGDSGGES